jgi:hypothetical protein
MSNYKFDFYAWGKALMQRKKSVREEQVATVVATKLTRQMIKDAMQLAIKTNNFENIPDDISNSDISNDSEIHYDIHYDIHDERQYDIHGHNLLYNDMNYTYPISAYPQYTYIKYAETVPKKTAPKKTAPKETVPKETKPVRKKSWFSCFAKKQ